jgi:uncharacterized protein (TIGR03435 family)
MILRLIATAVAAAGLTDAQAQTGTAKMEFDVASVKQSQSDDRVFANFPLGPGDVYVPNGGLLSVAGFPLVIYISFAYKLMANDGKSLQSQLPAWAFTDRYNIQARAEAIPQKIKCA